MGLFSNHKDKVENKQTQEIKQATISDSQKSNIDSAQTQPQPEANFTNPFANTQLNEQTQTNQSNLNQPNLEQQPNAQTQTNQLENPQTNNQTSFNTNSAEFSMDQQPTIQPQTNQQDLSFENHKEELSKEQITEMIDETVEKLIEEKWNSLMDNVNKIVKWKEKTEADISMLKEDLVNISDGFNKLENKLISKISNYDKDILDVNSEIKALEKVFQKITPTLINNVNELSKIADDFRGVKSSNKNKLSLDSEETKENQ